MNYISTRGQVPPVGFCDAVMMGLADDGGLLIPQSIPNVADRLDDWRDLGYVGLALEVLRLYADDIDAGDLRRLLERTYRDDVFVGGVAPLVKVDGFDVLELWHGPTLSFKDIALQLLGNLFEYILSRRRGRLNILGATSGDTGSAAIAGVRGRKGIEIFILHPHGRVSPIQQRQMTTVLDANVHNVAVEGSFDDCQRIMKALASDLAFKRKYHLGAVNSVNWARVLAQMVYYFHAAFAVQRERGAVKVRFAVPTGNFGDVLAGWYAAQMGAPIEQLILATNENDILARFFHSGLYERSEVHQTLSPAMDIQVASNFERYLYYKLDCDAQKLREQMKRFDESGRLTVPVGPGGAVDPLFVSSSATVDECLTAIRDVHAEADYLLDPHTAVAVAVAKKAGLDGSPVVCLATAHPAKFPEAIQRATGRDLARHAAIDALAELPTRCAVAANDVEAVRDLIVKTLSDKD